jgi:hypothetical protein
MAGTAATQSNQGVRADGIAPLYILVGIGVVIVGLTPSTPTVFEALGG